MRPSLQQTRNDVILATPVGFQYSDVTRLRFGMIG